MDDLAGEVAQFNDLVPVGTSVVYWMGVRRGPGIVSRTRGRAWLLGDHTPVVMIEGASGGVALTHVCPIPASPTGSDLPAGYRWATAEEAEDWENVPGIIVVPRTADASGTPYTQDEADLAVPITHAGGWES